MIEYSLVSFPLTGGLDTKVAITHLQRPQLQAAYECWQDQTGELRKRFGYQVITGGDSVSPPVVASDDLLSDPVSLVAFKGSHLAFSATYAYGWVDAAKAYAQLGGVMSIGVSIRGVAGSSARSVSMTDHATANGYTLHGTVEVSGTDLVLAWVLVEEATGAVVATGDLEDGSGLRVVARGDKLYLFASLSGEAAIQVRIFDTASTALLGASLFESWITVVSNFGSGASAMGSAADVAANESHGVFLAYHTTEDAVSYGFVDEDGVYADNDSYSAESASFLSVAVGPNDSLHGIALFNSDGTGEVYALVRNWDGATWDDTVTTATAVDSGFASSLEAISCGFQSTAKFCFWYSGDDASVGGTASSDYARKVHQSSIIGTPDLLAPSSDSVETREFTIYKAGLAGRPFLYDGVWYGLVQVGSPLASQSTLAVVSISGVATNREPVSGTPVAIVTTNGFSSQPVAHPTEVRAGVLQIGFVHRRVASLRTVDQARLAQFPTAAQVTLDMSPFDRHRSVLAGDSVYVGGGVLLQFDGVHMVEAGFLRYVEPTLVGREATAGSGFLTDEVDYSYMIVPEWTSAGGIREQGTNAGSLTVSMPATANTVTLKIPSIALTMKQDMVFAIYRTEANGTVFHRLGVVANDPTALEATYVDEAADSDIATTEVYYAQSDEVLDNTPTPASSILCEANGRVFMASRDVRGMVLASKLRTPDEPLTFNDALTIQVPDDSADITALAELGGALVIFTTTGIYRVAGEGPSNATSNGAPIGGWLTPESLSVDTGATCQRSVVAAPMGIMFRGKKGIMLLDQSFQVSYIGAPLENIRAGDETSQTTPPPVLVNGILVPHRQQVRFSDPEQEGLQYVYDYFHRQWYTWARSALGPDVVVGDTHVMIQRTEDVVEPEFTIFGQSVVVEETEDTYDDFGTPFAILVALAVMRDPASPHGEIRVRRVGVTGEVLAAGSLGIVIARDFAATSEPHDVLLSELGRFFTNLRIATRVSSVLQVVLTDDASGGAFRLHEIAFEIGVRSAGKGMGRK